MLQLVRKGIPANAGEPGSPQAPFRFEITRRLPKDNYSLWKVPYSWCASWTGLRWLPPGSYITLATARSARAVTKVRKHHRRKLAPEVPHAVTSRRRLSAADPYANAVWIRFHQKYPDRGLLCCVDVVGEIHVSNTLVSTAPASATGSGGGG